MPGPPTSAAELLAMSFPFASLSQRLSMIVGT